MSKIIYMQYIEHSDKKLGEINIINKKLIWLAGKPYYVFDGDDCNLFKTIIPNFPDKIYVSTNEFSGGKLIDDIFMVNEQHKLCKIIIGDFLVSGRSNCITQFNLKCGKIGIDIASIGQIGKIKLKQCYWYNAWLFPYRTQYIYIYKIIK